MNSGDRLNSRVRGQSIWEVYQASLESALKVIFYIWNEGDTSFKLISCFKAFSILGNLRGHLRLRLLHVISLPHARALARRHHRLAYRYLNPYLARGFRQNTSLNALTNHYEYLQSRVNDAFLMRVYDEGPAVWRECLEGHSLSIQLSFPKEHDCEGDLRMDFRSDSVLLYTMTFYARSIR
jgi:uncharacterized protein VirK/YbjX